MNYLSKESSSLMIDVKNRNLYYEIEGKTGNFINPKKAGDFIISTIGLIVYPIVFAIGLVTISYGMLLSNKNKKKVRLLEVKLKKSFSLQDVEERKSKITKKIKKATDKLTTLNGKMADIDLAADNNPDIKKDLYAKQKMVVLSYQRMGKRYGNLQKQQLLLGKEEPDQEKLEAVKVMAEFSMIKASLKVNLSRLFMMKGFMALIPGGIFINSFLFSDDRKFFPSDLLEKYNTLTQKYEYLSPFYPLSYSRNKIAEIE